MNPVLENRVISRVQAGVDEAEAILRSRALSQALSDGETSVCLFLPDGAPWAESSESAPFQSSLLGTWVRALADRRPSDDSTILVTNDPFDGGATTCDLRMIAALGSGMPGWVAVGAHCPDVGGHLAGGVAPSARTVHEEGVRVPIAPMTAGLLDLLSANARFPLVLRQDLEAMIGSMKAVRAWMSRLADTYGEEVLLGMANRLRDRAREAFSKGMTELAAGSYRRRDRLDNIDTEHARHLCLQIEVRDEGEIRFDFEGSACRDDSPTNCTRSATDAAVLCAVRQVFPEVPVCGFSIEDLEILTPHGSLLHAGHPDAVGGTSDILADRVRSIAIEALSQAVHGRGQACDGHGGNVLVIEGIDQDRPFALRLVVGAGGGASGHGDGLGNADAGSRHSIFPSLESLERAFPVRVTEYGERSGSGGSGRYRGGDGSVFELEATSESRLTIYADRFQRGAGGHHRGGRGTTTDLEIFRDGRWSRPNGPGRQHGVSLSKGDRVRIHTAGGGGYGHPYERAIRLLSDDVRSGRLTRRDAAKRHGVVYTSSDARDYDSAKTFKLRSYRLTSSDVDDFLDEIEALED